MLKLNINIIKLKFLKNLKKKKDLKLLFLKNLNFNKKKLNF
jgi:hypothetical protein